MKCQCGSKMEKVQDTPMYEWYKCPKCKKWKEVT